jgi:hypothetical protein
MPDVTHLSRRQGTALVLSVPLAGVLRTSVAAAASIEVWTGPGCGCCHEWVAHLRDNGFEVTTHDGGNSEARARLGIPAQFGSCHTGEAGGFALEGHVPAREISRLLEERPDAIGLSVPSMPRGSPGMDGEAYGNVLDPYDVRSCAATAAQAFTRPIEDLARARRTGRRRYAQWTSYSAASKHRESPRASGARWPSRPC